MRTPAFVLIAGLAVLPLPGAPLDTHDDVPLAALWQQPDGARDLFYGPGGRRLAPDADARYRVISEKIGGFSDGYHVVDPDGREWSAKFPPEASTEVVASRIHWGIGYQQPPIYFVPEWSAEGASAPNPQLPARFREKDPDFHGIDDKGSWSLDHNPFTGTRPLAGLIVLEVMLGNSDLKASNMSVYELDEPVYGASRWYVVRDLGHTFGHTGRFQAPRGDVDAFEHTGFIRGVSHGTVQFDYQGPHGGLLKHITPADVRWICERLAALTDRQLEDAFRAGGYEPHVAGRFIRTLKQKIAQGLALEEGRDES